MGEKYKEKDVLKDFNRLNIFFRIVMITLCIIFNLVIVFVSKDFKITFICLGFTMLILLGFYVYEKLFENHMSNILIKLSEMIATISDMKETEVFSQIDDSLFSKLQYQTIKLTKLLKSQNMKIEEDKEEIKSLISDIAHQLKTPLTNMKMYSEFLQDENLTKEERNEFNKVILISLQKLCFLVESMIKMSRLESSVIKLKPKKNSINETILMAITQLHKKAEIKNINIKFDYKEEICIVHDKNWTTEAIFNMIENAIKYSPKESHINITLQNYEMFTRIDITDEGIGIKEEEIPKIFSRFYRGENAYEEEGIGIGLYLSREIITKENGYIKVNSSEKGSTFSVFLQNNKKALY
ncbi:MAG: HAMP domain-containing sensor histidine kinase [Terrisporobacter sp.]|uniref:sensor histidine kinase n=1 Tax=Terrisporobacter sp. TaxID=1965305 RepID=UPI002FCBB19B